MTDATRLAALEAVAEAARSMTHGTGGILAVKHAVEALDALPAPAPQPAGEVVTLALWEDRKDGEMRLCRPGHKMDADLIKARHDWRRVADGRPDERRAGLPHSPATPGSPGKPPGGS